MSDDRGKYEAEKEDDTWYVIAPCGSTIIEIIEGNYIDHNWYGVRHMAEAVAEALNDLSWRSKHADIFCECWPKESHCSDCGKRKLKYVGEEE